MTNDTASANAQIFGKTDQAEVLNRWTALQLQDSTRAEGISDSAVKTSSQQFLKVFSKALEGGNLENLDADNWEPVLQMLAESSASRAVQGATPTETARFVFSLKQILFQTINEASGNKTDGASEELIWQVNALIDKLGLYTTEVFQKSREGVIRRQQKDLLEMSTPVIKLWDRVLAVPLIGTLDSARTQIVMENLLQAIVDSGAKIAILDITGVPTVDTQTAQHLMKTVSATRLMGAECIISGIRPQIAQTIVHLGIEINDILTKATMADALREALAKVGYSVEKDSDADKR
jgi:rsbT co-antagonist protein RsbR